jgi:hypothetical protein
VSTAPIESLPTAERRRLDAATCGRGTRCAESHTGSPSLLAGTESTARSQPAKDRYPVPRPALGGRLRDRATQLDSVSVWGSKIGVGPLSFGFRRRVRIRWLVHQDWPAPDLLVLEVRGEMIWVWRPKSQRSMWTPAVVVNAVPGEDGP